MEIQCHVAVEAPSRAQRGLFSVNSSAFPTLAPSQGHTKTRKSFLFCGLRGMGRVTGGSSRTSRQSLGTMSQPLTPRGMRNRGRPLDIRTSGFPAYHHNYGGMCTKFRFSLSISLASSLPLCCSCTEMLTRSVEQCAVDFPSFLQLCFRSEFSSARVNPGTARQPIYRTDMDTSNVSLKKFRSCRGRRVDGLSGSDIRNSVTRLKISTTWKVGGAQGFLENRGTVCTATDGRPRRTALVLNS